MDVYMCLEKKSIAKRFAKISANYELTRKIQVEFQLFSFLQICFSIYDKISATKIGELCLNCKKSKRDSSFFFLPNILNFDLIKKKVFVDLEHRTKSLLVFYS